MAHEIPNFLFKGGIFRNSINETETMCAEPHHIFLKTVSHSADTEMSLQNLGTHSNDNRDKETAGLAHGQQHHWPTWYAQFWCFSWEMGISSSNFRYNKKDQWRYIEVSSLNLGYKFENRNSTWHLSNLINIRLGNPWFESGVTNSAIGRGRTREV